MKKLVVSVLVVVFGVVLLTGCGETSTTFFEKKEIPVELQYSIQNAQESMSYYTFGNSIVSDVKGSFSELNNVELEYSGEFDEYLTTKYKIYRKNVNSFYPHWEKVAETYGKSYFDNIQNGLIYEYKVKAVYVNFGLESNISNIIKIDNREGYLAEPGTVKYINIEGGFYGIITEDGLKLDPVNLPDEYKQDGMNVRIWVKKAAAQVNFHMWGTIVEIKSIEQI